MFAEDRGARELSAVLFSGRSDLQRRTHLSCELPLLLSTSSSPVRRTHFTAAP